MSWPSTAASAAICNMAVRVAADNSPNSFIIQPTFGNTNDDQLVMNDATNDIPRYTNDTMIPTFHARADVIISNTNISPWADIFPLLDGDEYDALKGDITANGLLESIWIHPDGRIIDGRNRHRACLDTDSKIHFKHWDGIGSLISLVLSLNMVRRHLTPTQRAVAANDSLPFYEAEAKERQATSTGGNTPQLVTILSQADTGKARQKAAKATGASEVYVQAVKKIESDSPDLIPDMRAGKMTVPQAKREVAKRAILEKLESIEEIEVKKTSGVYDVIVIDPPWPMKKINRDVAPTQTEFEYPTMSELELHQLEIPCADSCHVWLWTTHKHLPMALRLLDKWGMKYICTFVWHKPGGFQPFGLPQYNCEFALYARRGTPMFFDLKNFPVCFSAPRGKHSEKPEEFYRTVGRVTSGRRLDMFSRRTIDGFDAWGKEAVNEK